MNTNKLVNYISIRLEQLEILASQGIVPGCLDSIEFSKLQGRINELKRTLDYISDLLQKELAITSHCEYNALLQEMQTR